MAILDVSSELRLDVRQDVKTECQLGSQIRCIGCQMEYQIRLGYETRCRMRHRLGVGQYNVLCEMEVTKDVPACYWVIMDNHWTNQPTPDQT